MLRLPGKSLHIRDPSTGYHPIRRLAEKAARLRVNHLQRPTTTFSIAPWKWFIKVRAIKMVDKHVGVARLRTRPLRKVSRLPHVHMVNRGAAKHIWN